MTMTFVLLEPTVIPELDRAILEFLLIFAAVAAAILLLTVSSIIGIIRAIRRHRRGEYSSGAVALAALATAISAAWLTYWAGNSMYQKVNPLDGLLAINFALCVLPFSWLFAAIRANTRSSLLPKIN